ncbi:hypothetical protein JTB14_007800 [Gonioctena quinquepunctata]|nr:hypothetical protein JTB14_007800 [Gonioctena quinquepunctata]
MAVEEKEQSYCTQLQKQSLINLMKEKENEPLLSGKFSQTFTFQDVKILARSKIENKNKKSEQIEHARGAVGGRPLPSKFDSTDVLILSTIAPTSITGDTNINETPIDSDFTFNDIMEDHPVAEQSVDYVIPNEGNAVVLNDHIYSKEDIIPSSTTFSKK